LVGSIQVMNLVRLSKAELLLRGDAGKDGRLRGGLDQVVVVQVSELAPGQRQWQCFVFRPLPEADLCRDGGGGEGVVAGDHFDGDARPAAGRDCPRGQQCPLGGVPFDAPGAAVFPQDGIVAQEPGLQQLRQGRPLGRLRPGAVGSQLSPRAGSAPLIGLGEWTVLETVARRRRSCAARWRRRPTATWGKGRNRGPGTARTAASF
jgi:hypothetical protein